MTSGILLVIILFIFPLFQFQKYLALDEKFILKVLPYFIPISLVYIIPLSVLLSSVFVFGRLSEDNELLAIKSSGVSIMRIMRPIFYLTMALSISVILINLHLIPFCHSQTRQLAISAFKNRIFTDSGSGDEIKLPQGKIYYTSSNKGVFDSVRVVKFDQAKEELLEELSAKQGKFEIDEENAIFSLHLNKVYITRWEKDKRTTHLINKQWKKRNVPHLVKSDGLVHTIDVSSLFVPSRKNLSALTERQLNEMIEQHKNNPAKTKQIILHKNQRYSVCLTPLIFAFIGIPLGILVRKGSKIAGIGISILLLFVGYYPLMMLGHLLGVHNVLPVFIAVWIANIIFGLLSLGLLYFILYKRN